MGWLDRIFGARGTLDPATHEPTATTEAPGPKRLPPTAAWEARVALSSARVEPAAPSRAGSAASPTRPLRAREKPLGRPTAMAIPPPPPAPPTARLQALEPEPLPHSEVRLRSSVPESVPAPKLRSNIHELFPKRRAPHKGHRSEPVSEAPRCVPPPRESPQRASVRILRSISTGHLLTAQQAQDQEIDEQFRRLESGAPPRGLSCSEGASDPIAQVENSSLFRRMAVTHGKPLKAFVLALREDEATSDWLEIVRPIVHNLLKAAITLDQPSLSAVLSRFLLALDQARAAGAHRLEGRFRHYLLTRYRDLASELPLAFAITTRQDQREPLLVHHLLQLSGARKPNIDRLHAAGLNSLSALCACSIADLAELGRLDFRSAVDISQLAHAYSQEQAELAQEQGRRQ